jgi:hypothetical protein
MLLYGAAARVMIRCTVHGPWIDMRLLHVILPRIGDGVGCTEAVYRCDIDISTIITGLASLAAMHTTSLTQLLQMMVQK